MIKSNGQAVVRLVRTSQYPRTDEETQRPFRIWDSVEKQDVAHRYYKVEKNALDSALLEVRWAKVGRTLEVYDISNGRWLGTYKRGLHAIEFMSPKGKE